MKTLILFFAFLLPSIVTAQEPDIKLILKKEVLDYKRRYPNQPIKKIGDSVVIAKKILKSETAIDSLKNLCINTEELRREDAEEIFSAEWNAVNATSEWTHNDFSGIAVTFYDEKKHSPGIYKRDDKKTPIGTSNILFLSQPILRKDNKYAVTFSYNSNDGGIATIFKNTKEGWTFYKTIVLYYT